MSFQNYKPNDPERSSQLLAAFEEWYDSMDETEQALIDQKIRDVSSGVKNMGPESVKEKMMSAFFYGNVLEAIDQEIELNGGVAKHLVWSKK